MKGITVSNCKEMQKCEYRIELKENDNINNNSINRIQQNFSKLVKKEIARNKG